MFCWVLVVALLSLGSSAELSPRITTPLGDVQGTTRQSSKGRTYFAFEGVPYAKPPVGKHRFKQSVLVAPWSGLWNATQLPTVCMQDVFPIETLGSSNDINVIGSEDCLYVNIYTPKLPSDLPDGKLLDVIFYIHGGAFRVGWGHMNGPEYIMDRDVVYVNFNYRVGVLGFFSLEDHTCPGNNGLKDQLLALKWVNQYIASFGGNPNKVTIMGTSAGGASVHYHLLSPQSKGLFQKAISNSGAVLNPWALTKNPRPKSLAIANSVGCSGNTSATILNCLRERPAQHLVAAINSILTVGKYVPINPLGPIIELPSPNAFISQQPIDIIKSKVVNDVPTLFSFTSDEGAFLGLKIAVDKLTASKVENEWDTLAPNVLEFDGVVDPATTKEVAQLLWNHYMGEKKLEDALPEFVQMFSDRYFLNGIQEAAILHAQNQASPVYSYRFSYTNPEIPSFGTVDTKVPYKGGAAHASDCAYVLKYNYKGSPDVKAVPEAAEMSDTMIDYYMSFITQTPLPGWESVKSGLPNYKFMDVVSPTPSQNVFKTEKPKGEYWNTLRFQENWSKNIQPSSNIHSEL